MNRTKGMQVSEFDTVEAWMAELRSALDLTGLGEVDLPGLLKAVREVAHSVTHPAGPVAMLAVGYAAARGGGSAEELDRLVGLTVDLAHGFAARQPPEGGDA